MGTSRKKTIDTTAVLRTLSIKTGKELHKSVQSDIECCQYINASSVVTATQKLRMELIINFAEMPAAYRNEEFIQKWIDFINTLGLDIKIKKANKIKYIAYMEDQVLEENYFYLFNLNLVRYLWSAHYDKFPKLIFMLRERKDLKHLDNWEIFQLVHHLGIKHKTGDSFHFNDMTPVDASKVGQEIYHITSQKFLTARLRECFDSNLENFNIPWKGARLNYTEIQKLAKNKNYLEIYNKLSLRHNSLSEYKIAKCIKNKGLTETLTLNSTYRILRELKTVIKIENDNYNPQLYKKSRFKLI